jgi:hypothetical protein
MDEARIENYLAKRVIENPNELSGARPADANAVTSQTASPAAASPVSTVSPVASTTNANAKTTASPAKK